MIELDDTPSVFLVKKSSHSYFTSYRIFILKNLLILLFLALICPLLGQNILQYRAVLLLVEPKQGNAPTELAIRSFMQDTEQMYVLVQPDSISTHIELAKNYRNTPTNWNFLRLHWATKPYIKALEDARQNDAPLQNAGLTHANNPEKGISLTVDLCPSRLPLDKRVFTALIQASNTAELPVPITLSMSGLWILTHKEDLMWLKDLASKNELTITWANHTLHHHWSKKLPLNENFLLERGTDLTTEVLGNEELLLKYRIQPSCFFRFPGLVSDKVITDQILAWGLIPIGSDAWLAKGENPKASGSIVLIHANGNEPVGVVDFLRLLREEKTALKRGQWRLLDLREELKKE